MKITVCCCTYNRPQLLEYMLHCFTQQDYEDRYLVILDDAGQLEPCIGDRWRVYSIDRRYPTLGAKRNGCALLAPEDTEVLVVWDDDDLFLPWGLTATAATMAEADWTRPSQSCLRTRDDRLWRIETFSKAIGHDKACQCSWGIRTKTFWNVGGYNEALSIGEDLDLAQKLEAAGVRESDPLTLGCLPWYVWGPWKNRHLSEPTQTYQGVPTAEQGRIRIKPAALPNLDLHNMTYRPEIGPRPWQQNWYGERRA